MSKISIIAGREFNERVRKKSFIITTILMPVFFVGLIVVMALMMNFQQEEEKQITVLDKSGMVAPKLQNSGDLIFSTSESSFEELTAEKQDDLYGILVIGENVIENPKNVQFYTYESSTINIEKSITDQIENILEEEKLKSYNIENLPQILAEIETPVSMQVSQITETGETKAVSNMVNIAIAYLFGLMIYMVVFLYGNMVMQGVIEEKSNKVLEVMVSSVKPFQLMMGKILGIAAVAVLQFVIWVVFIVGVGGALMNVFAGDMIEAAAAMQSGMPMDMTNMAMDADMASVINTITDPGYLIRIFGGFLIFFIGGYLLYSAMFAAVGSAVDNEKDTQNLQLPISIPLILALVVMVNAMQDPNGQLAFWFSMIPFTSPVVMMARLPYGVPDWQLWLSIALLFITFVGMVWLAGKIYRVGIFMYGKKPTLKELIKWSRYKA
ncbi:MAG: ABC transporter permease [Tidjanibacter sp.]|nr:ABC transporter permease [Tidjanibacter sp.]